MSMNENADNENLDKEWIDLIDCARQLGIGQEEIRRFLRELQEMGNGSTVGGQM